MSFRSVALLLEILAVMCFQNVSSLKCYSCFSYDSNKDCESRYNLKEIECDKEYDTCLKYEMTVTIAESDAGKTVVKTNKAYARYCGSTTKDCSKSIEKPTICRRMFTRSDAQIIECKITCCDSNLESKCHERPHWPGTQWSSSSFSSNNSDVKIYKGERGTASLMTVSIWFPLVFSALLRLMF